MTLKKSIMSNSYCQLFSTQHSTRSLPVLRRSVRCPMGMIPVVFQDNPIVMFIMLLFIFIALLSLRSLCSFFLSDILFSFCSWKSSAGKKENVCLLNSIIRWHVMRWCVRLGSVTHKRSVHFIFDFSFREFRLRRYFLHQFSRSINWIIQLEKTLSIDTKLKFHPQYKQLCHHLENHLRNFRQKFIKFWFHF